MLPAAARLGNAAFNSSPHRPDFICRQIGTPLVDEPDCVGISGRLLRMCREAVSFTRCRGAGGQEQVHLPLPAGPLQIWDWTGHIVCPLTESTGARTL